MSLFNNAILEEIRRCEHDIEIEDVPAIQEEFIQHINKFCSDSARKVFYEIDQHEKPDQNQVVSESLISRVVIIGDIHCDFESLKRILLKLSESSYPYFEQATFIFLGDYIDRGALPLQTLRLLFAIKELLGPRCIFLKGNHDSIFFDTENHLFYSKVKPAETVDLFNEYFQEETLLKFKEFFEILPFFVLINSSKKKYFLVHGGITKDRYLSQTSLDDLRNLTLPLNLADHNISVQYHLLNNLLWGDPADAKVKVNDTSSRFEFGEEQFLAFKEKINFTHMIRGHEPKAKGFEAMYDDQLFTVFSTGGKGNTNSFYEEMVPDPAFAVIHEDGSLHCEHFFNG